MTTALVIWLSINAALCGLLGTFEIAGLLFGIEPPKSRRLSIIGAYWGNVVLTAMIIALLNGWKP